MINGRESVKRVKIMMFYLYMGVFCVFRCVMGGPWACDRYVGVRYNVFWGINGRGRERERERERERDKHLGTFINTGE